MAYTSFEDLDVWKRSTSLAVRIINALRSSREFGLKDQITRAAVSIPSNIAEGSERYSNREYSRFLYIARGSAAELRTQLYIARNTCLLDIELASELIEEVKEISAMLRGLARSLES